MIESVDSIKLAGKIEKELKNIDRASLPILIQVHSGDEDSKNGLPLNEVDQMLTYLDSECPRL